MKKICCIVLISGILFAENVWENIVKAFDSEDIAVKVVEVQELNKGLSIAIVEQKNGTQLPIFITNDGKNIMGIGEPLILSSETYQDKVREFYKKTLEHNQKNTDIKILNNTPKESWIALQGRGRKGSIYFVLDANCVYCKQEMENIEQILQDYKSIFIVFVGFLKQDSMYRAAKIYNEIIKIKDQDKKIIFLKKAFGSSFAGSEKIDLSFVKNHTRIIGQTGIRGVPYIIKKD
ncbi:hypothetical protein [Helicobacter anatolicus]|uniref:hypothetical protein n=1 Tax=Helicobacter anatolicus TaxID=2905874 RepID=UPI001E31C3E0|nr:hypothetical protein [Helicobacter anatolicus]MCE3038963.1 hypothetical protein [Helicobacter anatolicus]